MDSLDILYQEIEKQQLWEEKRDYERGDYIKIAGRTDRNIYYVVKGSVRVFVMDGNSEMTTRFGVKRSFISALDSYISGKPSDLYIQALKKTELKVISKTRFEQFIWSSEATLKLWLEFVSQLVYELIEREKDILTVSPQKRYERVLQRSPHLFQEIPHKYIASYLRMTPETLSRLQKS